MPVRENPTAGLHSTNCGSSHVPHVRCKPEGIRSGENWWRVYDVQLTQTVSKHTQIHTHTFKKSSLTSGDRVRKRCINNNHTTWCASLSDILSQIGKKCASWTHFESDAFIYRWINVYIHTTIQLIPMAMMVRNAFPINCVYILRILFKRYG